MPIKDPEARRRYFREYMRRRRQKADVKPESATHASPQRKFDPKAPHRHVMTKIDGRWQRTLEQGGRLFDRDTGVEIILTFENP